MSCIGTAYIKIAQILSQLLFLIHVYELDAAGS